MSKDAAKSALEAARSPRRYVHFDSRLSRSDCEKLVTVPDAVSRHAFFPFLRHDLVRTKFKRVGPKQVKRSRKIRDIRYAAHADAAIYAYYNFILTDRYEACLKEHGLTSNVIAFRALSRSNVDFAQEVFQWIDSNRPCVAMGFDVKDFFGSLDHRLLKQRWASLMGGVSLPDDHYAVFRSLTRHASVELLAAREALGLSRASMDRISRLCDPLQFRQRIRDGGLIDVNSKPHGIPQGSPVSAALSNIYMLSFDSRIRKETESRGGLYRRYCDDILVVIPDTDIKPIQDLVDSELRALKLTMQHSKTVVSRFGDGKSDIPLPYLGLIYDGVDTQLRAAGVSRFYVRMRRGVAQLKEAKKTDGGKPLVVQRRKKLLNRYSEHTPKEGRSYFRYVKMAERKTNSKVIGRQLKAHRRRLKSLLGT